MANERLLAFLAAAAVAGCAHPPGEPPAGDAAAEVMRLDAAWAQALARGDADGWRARVAEDAVFSGRALLRGREEVWSAWKAFFAEGGPSIRWTPDGGGAAGSGDLAWTTGRFRLERKGANGKPVAVEGRYLTVWIRDAGGVWRVALDSSLQPAEDAGVLERIPVRTLSSRDGTLEAGMGTWTQDVPPGRRSGAWIALREKAAGEWKTRLEGFVEFPPSR